MDRPTFIILGATKAGTSTLHDLLGQHPDVLVSDPKETHFFDDTYGKGLSAYWRDHFSRWTGQAAAGEATPAYLFLPFVAERIRRDLPDVKLIVSLRNPMDRAHAEWWMRHAGARDDRPFEVAIVDELVRLSAGVSFDGPAGLRLWRANRLIHPNTLTVYLSGGHYAEHLAMYLELFPQKSLQVVLFDDLVSNPEAVARDLWRFLGVDPTAPLADRRPRNVARGKWTAAFYRMPLFPRLLQGLPSGPRGTVRRWLDRTWPRPPMAPTTRKMLVEYYRERNRTLEGLIGRNLSTWNT